MAQQFSRVLAVFVNSADTIVLPPNGSRVGVVLYPGTGAFAVRFGEVVTSPTDGMRIGASVPVEFWKSQMGELICSEIHAWAAVGANCGVLEIFES